MPTGFMCVGTHGVTQITSDMLNMVFVKSGILSFNNNGSQFQSASVSFTGESPMIFLKNTQLWVFPCGFKRSGNTWTWEFFARDSVLTNLGVNAGAENVPYYIFDRQPNVETRVGLNIYTPGGRVAFNSDYRPLRFAAIIQNDWRFNALDRNKDSPPISQYIGGSNYAAMLPTPGFVANGVHIEYGQGETYHQGFKLTNGNTFQTTRYQMSAPYYGGSLGGGLALVIDISRLG